MAKKTTLNKKLINKVKEYSKKLLTEGISADQLIVFGSYAKGKAKPWSDIDVGVVSRKFGKDHHSELVELLKLRGEEFLDIEPHPLTPADLKDAYCPLASEIRKYGIRVV